MIIMMTKPKIWVPAHELSRPYALMMERRNGVLWVLVFECDLTEEQKEKYGVKP